MKKPDYDIIIIGTGAAGGTLARMLAPSGKRVLVLERGGFLPKEKQNWESKAVNGKGCYQNAEQWYDKSGNAFQPFTHYYVGGNTKFYGSAHYRLREKDFDKVIHKGGISPAWPLKYKDFEPYYTQAEKLFDVHGLRGDDPTEPPSDQPFPFPPISHEPTIAKIGKALETKGFHPTYQPLGLKLNEANAELSECIRCETCDGFPCMVNAKADGDINGIRPTMMYPNITLKTHAKVERLHTSPDGKTITAVEAKINGKRHHFSATLVVVSAGALNSAVLLLRSANKQHPNGLANSSDLVGRNFMRHKICAIVSLGLNRNPTVYPKTMAINDYYWGEADFPYPMGHIQTLGNVNEDRAATSSPPFIPSKLIPMGIFRAAAERTTPWFLIGEDLPDPNNRIRLRTTDELSTKAQSTKNQPARNQLAEQQIVLEYSPNNQVAFDRLVTRWKGVLKSLNPLSVQFTTDMTLKDVGHQCGTCRFGEDPKTSVLNLNCQTHDVDNLYVVDGSFFPSSAALNPTLTIVANAIRVSEHLIQRLSSQSADSEDETPHLPHHVSRSLTHPVPAGHPAEIFLLSSFPFSQAQNDEI
ncbi:MAG: GMC family oxidoreductase [Cyanobacteria bacterium P01_D01_bin.36]